MNPWDLAGEAFDEAASSAGIAAADACAGNGAVVSLSAFEVDGSIDAKVLGDEGPCA